MTQSNSYSAPSRFQVTELVDNLDGFTSVTCERDIDWNGEPQPRDGQDLIVERTKADAD